MFPNNACALYQLLDAHDDPAIFVHAQQQVLGRNITSRCDTANQLANISDSAANVGSTRHGNRVLAPPKQRHNLPTSSRASKALHRHQYDWRWGRGSRAGSTLALRQATSGGVSRRAVLAARFLQHWCHWFLSPLLPCAGSKDASGHCCADVFTAKGCGQQGAGAARALLPHRAVRALASRALLPHRTVRALVPPLRFGRRHPAASRSAGPDPHPGGRSDKMIPRARFSPLLGHPAKLGCAVLPMCALAVASKSQWVAHVCHG
jgi:hypothetical protein